MKSNIIARYVIVVGAGFSLFSAFQNCAPNQKILGTSNMATTAQEADEQIVTYQPAGNDTAADSEAAVSKISQLGQYQFFIDGHLSTEAESISYEQAIQNCTGNAVGEAESLVLCMWDGRDIFSNVGLKIYRGFLNDNVFISKRNTSYKDAISHCLQNAEKNLNVQTRCTWGEDEIYLQAANQ